MHKKQLHTHTHTHMATHTRAHTHTHTHTHLHTRPHTHTDTHKHTHTHTHIHTHTHTRFTCVLLFVARQLVHLPADLGLEAVDDEVQRLGAAGVHVDEELVLLFVAPRRTGLDVGQVDALLLLVVRSGVQSREEECFGFALGQ